jgi:anti-repressor protein
MSNQLQIFNYQSKQVRTVTKDGEPWFVAKDICDILELGNSRMALERLDNDEKGVSLIDTPGGTQSMQVVNEPGLYVLILGSRKKEAKQFKRWITHEVIPSIRKNGGYIANQENLTPEQIVANALIVAQNIIAEKDRQLEAQKPKVLFADAVSASKSSILIGELAKILKQNGVDTGQNRLFDWLRRNGYLISRRGTDYNMPTQRSMELGLFEIKETTITHSDGRISVSKTVKATGKGQQYFINKFLEKGAVSLC